jgi:hypothetical protein
MNNHCPAVYLKLGLTIRNSMAPREQFNNRARRQRFHGRTTGVNKDFRELRRSASPNFPPYTLAEVDDAGPNSELPAHVS